MCAGPAAGLRVPTGTVGRAELGDPTVAPHHLWVDPNGQIRSLGPPLTRTRHVDGVDVVTVGMTTLMWRPAERPSLPRTVITRVARRRRTEPEPPSQLAPPEAPPPSRIGQVVATAVATAAVAVIIAIVTSRAVLALFAAGGVLTAAVTSAFEAGRQLRYRRACRQHSDTVASRDDDYQRELVAFRRTRWPVDLSGWRTSTRLWERRHDDDDAMSVVVGVGDHDVAVEVDLSPGTVTVIRGSEWTATAVMRSLLAQAIVMHGPADLRVSVRRADVPAPAPAYVTGTGRHHLIVTDDYLALGHAGSDLRQRLREGAAVVVQVPSGVANPALSTTTIDVDATCRGVIAHHEQVSLIRLAGCTTDQLVRLSQGLACCVDPEVSQPALPSSITLHDVLERDGSADNVVIGVDDRGTVSCDPVSDGPHMLIAGTTGSGKSEALRALITAVAATQSPDRWQVCLIDAKGGAGLDIVSDLPHVVGIVTDLDEFGVRDAICGLEVEMRRREQVLRANGHRDISTASGLARLLIVIDEFAAVVRADDHARAVLVDIAQRGRSLGMHLVLATQRPAGSVPDDLRANVGTRLCLRVNDRADSVDVIGRPDAAVLPAAFPGRAVAVFPDGRCTTVQIARVDAAAERRARQWPDPTVRIIAWTPPPTRVAPDALERTVIVSRPDLQTHRPVCWAPVEGTLSIVGDIGSGTTTAAVAVTTRLSDAMVYVVTSSRDPLWDDAARCPHIADPVDVHDVVMRHRLLTHLETVISERRRDRRGAAVVVVLDAAAGVMRAVDTRESRHDGERLQRILDDGPAVGVIPVLVGPPLRAGVGSAARWLFRLRDPADRARVGASDRLGELSPGRCIVRDGGADRDGIVVPADIEAFAERSAVAATTIVALPTEVTVRDLHAASPEGELRVGIGFDEDHELVMIPTSSGTQIVIVGPATTRRDHVRAAVEQRVVMATRRPVRHVEASTLDPYGSDRANCIESVHHGVVTMLTATPDQLRRLPPDVIGEAAVRIHIDLVAHHVDDPAGPPSRPDLLAAGGVGPVAWVHDGERWRPTRLPAVDDTAMTAMLVA